MDSLEDKQILLRREVLEGGLNADQFVDYLGTLKGDNVELQNWSMQQLQNAIADFKARRAQAKNQLMSSRLTMSMMMRKSKIFQPVRKEKVQYDNSLWDYEVLELQDCLKSEVDLGIPSEGPRVKVEKHEIKSVGGFIFGIGARNELHLTISTNFTQDKVQRKSEDVDWLRNILAVDFPGHLLPALEPDRELNADDKLAISSRINEIEGFLNKVMKFTAFQHSRHVQVFFEEYNTKKFSEFRNREVLLEVVRDPDCLETATGTLLIEISEKNNKTIKQASVLGGQISVLYNELLNCSTRIAGYMEKTKKQIGFLYNICNKLGEKYTEAQNLFKLEEIKLPTIFMSFGNIASNTFKNLERHIRAYSELTEGFTKNLSRDWNELVAHDGKIQKEFKRYLGEKEALQRKKERYINDISKWELPEADYLALKTKDLSQVPKDQKLEKMFPGETETEGRYRNWIAVMNHNYIESYQQFLKQQESFLLSKYLPYSGQATCLSRDLIANLQEFSSMIFG